MSASGGLLLSFSLPTLSTSKPWQQPDATAIEINAWLSIAPDDTIVIRVAKAEMGQGVLTSLPMQTRLLMHRLSLLLMRRATQA